VVDRYGRARHDLHRDRKAVPVVKPLRYLAAFALAFRGLGRRKDDGERMTPSEPPSPGAEVAVILLLLAAAAAAIAFVFFYATSSLSSQTQLLGASLGLCFAFIAIAGIVISKRLVVTEELEEDYPEVETEHEEEREQVAKLVEEGGQRFTRKRLLGAVAAFTGGSLGAALLVPAVSLGPFLAPEDLDAAPWRRGIRLTDENGNPFRAADIEHDVFYTAYPEHTNHDLIGAPLVMVRMNPDQIHLPAERAGWAPDGILAYSKICTHAGCAISLYRKPTFPPVQPRPAFVCPCHYSTFDPADGGSVLFGPAGRNLPQLPLIVDGSGYLRAGGNFSGPIGPSWWGVRMQKAHYSR
jgi:ubiquinol-cytochrome c reductase iron-sulfur subunit